VQLSVTASFVANDKVYYMANGVQASYVEVDCETGFIKMLGQWAVDDCGRIINPLLVDEQVRGGIVQGIGAVLFEECVYSEDANLLNGTMADYLVPMAGEMPDILVDHVETPELSTRLGAKGVGEGGLIGTMGSVWVAVNDALKPPWSQNTASALYAGTCPRRVGSRALDSLSKPELPAAPLWKLFWIEVVRGYGDTTIDFDVPCVVFGTRNVLDLTSILVEGLHPSLA
jgi:xanthine dehydrogenase molybdopterin-binding subunit B